jgi:hypothetical protein
MPAGNGATTPPKARRNGGRGVSSAPKLLTLDDLDQRTRAAQLARQHRDDLTSDLGGEGRLTAGQSALIQRAAVLHSLLVHHEVIYLRDGKIELSEYLAASGEFRRVAMCLGIAERYAQPVGSAPTLEQRSARFFDAAAS